MASAYFVLEAELTQIDGKTRFVETARGQINKKISKTRAQLTQLGI